MDMKFLYMYIEMWHVFGRVPLGVSFVAADLNREMVFCALNRGMCEEG